MCQNSLYCLGKLFYFLYVKVIEHLRKQGTTTPISFEILPPLKGKSMDSVSKILDELVEYNPSFINVTYHRTEYKYKLRENGLFEKVYTRKRPGTVGICAAIQYKYGIDAVPHLVCGGFSRNETEDALLDLNYLGIDNVLLLRGDPIKTEKIFQPELDGNHNSLELIQQVVNLNKGIYLEEELEDSTQTNFCIGVSGYPEKHYESPNSEADLRFLKKKVDSGADYIVTQMFFDNQKYFDFVQRCRAADIHVPIIPGLKPITTLKQVYSLPGYFHVSIPDELCKQIEACKNNKEDIKKAGIEWLANQCKELIQFGVPCLHFYTMSKADHVKALMKLL